MPKRPIENNLWPSTIEFIHEKQGIVVKRCFIEDLPNPLPPEYRLPIKPKLILTLTETKVCIDSKCAVYKLYNNGQGRYAYFFDRLENL